jgi:predicted branched-subunit amino acid permease
MVLATVPFGLLIGMTLGRMHLGAAPGLGSAALYFGGSGHFAALTLLQDGAGPLAVLATVAVVNCRLALYAAALAPRFADQPAWFRWLAPQVLIDQVVGHGGLPALVRPTPAHLALLLARLVAWRVRTVVAPMLVAMAVMAAAGLLA